MLRIRAITTARPEQQDLSLTRKILGMEIEGDCVNHKLYLSQKKYIENVLRRYRMKSTRLATSPLGAHFKLSKADCTNTKENHTDMEDIPYASMVGSLMYAMTSTRLDIA